MRNIFKRRRPRHAGPAHRLERLEPAEAKIVSAWGLSEADWRGMTDFERAECRRNVTAAPRFQP